MITWCYNLPPWVIQKTSVEVGSAACEYNMKINCANECKHGVGQLKGSQAVVLCRVMYQSCSNRKLISAQMQRSEYFVVVLTVYLNVL